MAKETSLFISHTTRDPRDFDLAHKIAEKLRSRGLSVWIAPDSIPPGDEWEESIVSAIMEKCSHFLVILSAASIRADWVLKEIKLAQTYRGYNEHFTILPLVVGQLDSYPGSDFLQNFQNVIYKENVTEQTDEIISAMGLRSAGRLQLEERVAEIYRLLHFNIEYEKDFSERKVGMFLTRRIADMTIHRAIDCQMDTLEKSDIDLFSLTMRSVNNEYALAQGTIVTGSPFKFDLLNYAKSQNIQLITYDELSAQLFDGQKYARRLIRECESNERYRMPLYIESFIGYETSDAGTIQTQVIDEWLKDSEWNQLTLLGDVGTGKSFLCRINAYRLAINFLRNPLTNPLPILIDLRKAEREFSLEGLILTHFAQNELSEVTFDVFRHALSSGRIILLLDGFDEMAARVTRQITNRNFNELIRCVEGRAKVLLTCRTHYFKSRTEEEEVVLGTKQDYGSEIARDLYWELIARRGYKIAYLIPFNISQIEQYVRRIKPKTYKDVLRKIRTTYNLMELAHRPMLLEMIVKSIDKLEGKQINAATLYKIVTDVWIHRDEWRDVLDAKEKLAILMNLAQLLWFEDTENIHYTNLFEYVKKQFDNQVIDSKELFEIDNEIRTASFLTRDDSGNYSFAHRSHMEFFFARYLAEEFDKENFECLNTRRFTPEIIGFLQDLIDESKLEDKLTEILCDDYKPLISENALLCLYGFRRNRKRSVLLANDQNSKDFIIPLPRNMKLGDAQLEQVTLEGAQLEDADLSRANLTETILNFANLINANLDKAIIEKASLSSANLMSVCASEAVLTGANLENADLTGANLKNADLSDSYLIGAKLGDVDLTSAIVSGAEFPNEYKRLAYENILPKDRGESHLAEQSNLDEFWNTIERLRPWMLQISRVSALHKGIETEDIVSDIIVLLATQRHIENILKMAPNAQKIYIYEVIKHSSNRLSLKENQTNVFWENINLESDTDEDFHNLEQLTDDLEEDLDEEDLDEEDLDEEDLDEDYGLDKLRVYEIGSSKHLDIDGANGIELADLQSWEDKLLDDYLVKQIKSFLSDELWEVVKAKYWYGYTTNEIANLKKTSPASIHAMLRKSMILIRRNITGKYINLLDKTK